MLNFKDMNTTKLSQMLEADSKIL